MTLLQYRVYASSLTAFSSTGFALTTRDRTSKRTPSNGNVAVIGIFDEDGTTAGGVDDDDDAAAAASRLTVSARTEWMVVAGADVGVNNISKCVTIINQPHGMSCAHTTHFEIL